MSKIRGIGTALKEGQLGYYLKKKKKAVSQAGKGGESVKPRVIIP